MAADRRAVLIGGGITGVLTARELIRAGWDVTVLEGAHVGAGSSSRTAAGIRQQFSTPGTVHGMRYSVAEYLRFTDEVEEGTCPIVQNGYLFLIADDAAMEAARGRVAMQHACGLTEVEALDAAELGRRFPQVDPDAIVGGTWCPTDGFLLPHLVYNEGARVVREGGGRVLQAARVTGARHAGGRMVAVETTKGDFEADLFFDCTNAWSPRVAEVLGAAALPIAPRKRYLYFLDRDGPLTEDDLASFPMTICPTGVYCRPENRGTMLMGKKHPTDAEPGFDYEDQDQIAPDFSHKTGVEAYPFELWMEVAEALPPVGEFAGISATTSGYYAETPDHNPFLGYDPAVANLVRLVGFSGHGAMFGPFTARVGRELAEAGAGLDAVYIDGVRIGLAAFRIGRQFTEREAMVI